MREQIGLAYLFARAADTIADTDVIEQGERLALLRTFQAQFYSKSVDWDVVCEIKSALFPHQASVGERALLQQLEECFHVLQAFSPNDQELIRLLMQTLTKGMEMDLELFSHSAHEVTALSSFEELDRYTYYVAGCVGEFWTAMVATHVPSLMGWNIAEMAKIGVRFGKGLQLTNIVKDLARDIQRGRCYVPEVLLQQAGLKPCDLLNKKNDARVKPLLRQLISIARDHLDQGWLYTMAIPSREVRLRLACMWPILFAGQTLRRVAESTDILNPYVNIKMPKGQVYRIMLMTVLTGGSGYIGSAYWGRLRKMFV